MMDTLSLSNLHQFTSHTKTLSKLARTLYQYCEENFIFFAGIMGLPHLAVENIKPVVCNLGHSSINFF